MSRVCIRRESGYPTASIDVALPADAPVVELLPAIVALFDDGTESVEAAHPWRLDHPTRGPLRDHVSLCANDVRDGDLLVLVSDRDPPLGVLHTDPWHPVIAAGPPAHATGPTPRDVLVVLTTLLGAAVLASAAGSERALPALVVAAVGAVAALVIAVVTEYVVPICLSLVATAAATGFLAVPSTPATPNVFLGATAALCTALLTTRLSTRASPPLIATAAVAFATAVATVVALPAAATGALLASIAVAQLALAPRIAAWATGLAPPDARCDAAERAVRAHAVLSGLVAGAAAGGAAGAVVAAVGARTSASGAPAILDVLIGVALLLRARTYADPPRQSWLVAGAVVAIAAGGAAWPVLLCPVAGMLVLTGLVAARGPTIGPAAARLIDRAEYAVLVAILPVAAWAAGVHDLLARLPVP
ncbi:type VII secretion integral membrane protein EccD [Mycolicibacterium madagascariense]|uniref:Type VII secretion integral membrane protein EccD n=1 Tax=Mycolicibacterium madagascariense TaxID=212765 RepID=A0A7I7XCC8_9MYCO|nr:type VII secretion integral membrane protein EccD [Mycolicibacterium madagascariense]